MADNIREAVLDALNAALPPGPLPCRAQRAKFHWCPKHVSKDPETGEVTTHPPYYAAHIQACFQAGAHFDQKILHKVFREDPAKLGAIVQAKDRMSLYDLAECLEDAAAQIKAVAEENTSG